MKRNPKNNSQWWMVVFCRRYCFHTFGKYRKRSKHILEDIEMTTKKRMKSGRDRLSRTENTSFRWKKICNWLCKYRNLSTNYPVNPLAKSRTIQAMACTSRIWTHTRNRRPRTCDESNDGNIWEEMIPKRMDRYTNTRNTCQEMTH